MWLYLSLKLFVFTNKRLSFHSHPHKAAQCSILFHLLESIVYIEGRTKASPPHKPHPSVKVVVPKNMIQGAFGNEVSTVFSFSCVTLRKLFKLSEPQSLHLEEEILIPRAESWTGSKKYTTKAADRVLWCWAMLPSFPASFLRKAWVTEIQWFSGDPS